MNIPLLSKILDTDISERIKERISRVLQEEDAYAADELVVLCEEVLHQVAAVGFVKYMSSSVQKDVYNDYLIQLFDSNKYNALPLYKWAANMFRDCIGKDDSGLYSFYWDTKDDIDHLCNRILALGELRNSFMHGFFVLPPERNRSEANNIASLLMDLLGAGFFNCKGDFHFFRRGAFTGQWVITEPSQWIALQGDTSFGKLVSSVILEQGDAFWAAEQTRFENYGGYNVPDRLKDFVKNNVKGSFAWWLHPNDVNADRKSASIAQWLFSQSDIITIAYGLHPSGLSYTSSFLIKRLIQVLNPSGRTFGKKTSDKDKVISLRKECNNKVVIFIDTIHVGLFNEQHVIRMKDFMYANNIILIATGHHYSYFDSYFNSSDAVFHPLNVPTVDQRIACLLNFLRFRGPFFDKIEDSLMLNSC